MLEDHANLTARASQFFFSQRGEFTVIYLRAAFGWAFQQVNAANQRTFTCAGSADHAVNLPGRDMQADIVQRLYGAVPLLEHFGNIRKFNHQLFIIV